ncbi:hypothetical protein AVEN_33178-1 [Araneus ventricosus]|uniref:Uncharacterized protein n=1 Tax=Araneus ventricosus TaxID=182803 RepID=A0A4Y2A9Q8_ARAVE|nr:hypothetical protein AVEN_33178-1 [Araneus ventricosus]
MDSKMKLQKKTCLIAISQKNCTLSHKGMQSLQSFRSLPIPIKKSKRVLAAGLCTEEVSRSNSRKVARGFLDRFQRFGETSVNAGGQISTAINPQGLFHPNASFSGSGFVSLLYIFKEKRKNLFCELN